MYLYLIFQTANDDYDTYDSAIVAAESEQEARNIHPGNGDTLNPKVKNYNWVNDPDLVTVKFVGMAAPDVVKGVVLASFNCG